MPSKPPTHRLHPPAPRPREDRPNSTQRGYGIRWQRYRAWFLAQPENVFCRAEGCNAVATVVDHIVPHRGDYGLMWDATNHQALCKFCHDRKTSRGD